MFSLSVLVEFVFMAPFLAKFSTTSENSMADVRNDPASAMDGQSGKANSVQEGSLSQKSTVMTKAEKPEEEPNSFKKEGNKAPFSPVAHSFSCSKPIFGGSSKIGSPVLASPRLGSTFGANPFAMKPATFGTTPKLNCTTSSFSSLSSSPKPVYLRPSQLAFGNTESPSQAPSNSILSQKPSSLGNPFARMSPGSDSVSDNEAVEEGDKSADSPGVSKLSEDVVGSNNNSTEMHKENVLTGTLKSDGIKKAALESNTQKVDSGSPSRNSSCVSQRPRGIMTPPKFVPLETPSRQAEDSSCGSITSTNTTTSTATTSSATSSTAATGFVFGQNLHERVAEAVTLESTDSTSRTSEAAGSSCSMSSLCASATTNGTTEMLFTSVIKKDHNNDNSHSSSNNINDANDKPSKSLSEAAREYEEARAVKRKYEEVTIVTGEEDEANVLQMNCKLFAFDKAGGSWVERGRGTLRLNDKDTGPGGGGIQSRVVIRTSGSLRVVLNTKIWAGMSVDRPSPKSVRLTAMDNSGQIKVFLVMSSPKESELLHKSLECRVLQAQKASSSQHTQNEAKATDGDLASHSLPPEPSSKKRVSQSSEVTGSSSDVATV